MSESARRKAVKPDYSPVGRAGHSPAKWRLAERLSVKLNIHVSRLLSADMKTLGLMEKDLNRSASGVGYTPPAEKAKSRLNE